MGKFLFGLIIGCAASYWWLAAPQEDGPAAAMASDSLKSKAAVLIEDVAALANGLVGRLMDEAINIGIPLPKDLLSKLPGSSSEANADIQLSRVIDGDTIDLSIDGTIVPVRYIGANTPERDDPCYQDALNANRKLLQSGPLRLDTDATDKDRYGRLLRYVYAGDLLVERELIRQGWAEVVLYRSDDKHYDEFLALEQAAAAQGLGCHPTGIFDDGSVMR